MQGFLKWKMGLIVLTGPNRTTYGIRTRDSSVKGRRLNPLTNAAFYLKDGKDTLTRFRCQIFYVIKMLISFIASDFTIFDHSPFHFTLKLQYVSIS